MPAYQVIPAGDVDAKSPLTDQLMGKVKDDLDNLDGRFATPGTFMLLWNVAGTYTWTCPVGIENVMLEMWAPGGGGGGGGNAAQNPGVSGGGGGPGAWVRRSYPVVPGVTYTIVIGDGGAPGNGAPSQTNGSTGGITYFDVSTNKAQGGNGGESASNGAHGGTSGAPETIAADTFSLPGGSGADQAGGTPGNGGVNPIPSQFNSFGNGGRGGITAGGFGAGGNGVKGNPGALILTY